MKRFAATLFSAILILTLTLVGQASSTDQEAISCQGKPKIEDVVKIEFLKKEYTYTVAEAAKGIKIPYKIIVEQDLSNVIPLPYGPSNYTPAGPSGMHPLERISGNGNNYALLDFGLGRPPQEIVKTIKKGTYTHTFEWDGRNWNGPSDTGQPKGKPFPPGTYDLTISMHGKVVTDAGKKPYEITRKAKVVLK